MRIFSNRPSCIIFADMIVLTTALLRIFDEERKRKICLCPYIMIVCMYYRCSHIYVANNIRQTVWFAILKFTLPEPFHCETAHRNEFVYVVSKQMLPVLFHSP